MLLLGVCSLGVLFFISNAPRLHAASVGYELYQDDKCEIYIEYFPIFPTDSSYATASEEFAFKFYIRQEDWWENVVCHLVPWGWTIDIYFRDDTCGDNNWTIWKRWYPISMSQQGLKINWALSGGYGPLSVGASVQVPDTVDFLTNYTKFEIDYNGKSYMRVGFLDAMYNSNHFWGTTYAEGGGSIGIPNDLAAAHIDHHIEVLVRITVWWVNFVGVPYETHYSVDFILGDDNPPMTDCWLEVKQGNTDFFETNPVYRRGRGGGSLYCYFCMY